MGRDFVSFFYLLGLYGEILLELVDRILKGDIHTAARLMREIDAPTTSSRKALASLHAHTGHAHIVGITGSPGVGKSTLIGRLIQEFRAQGIRIGAVVVDPTSPFTAGALLGDRIRMQQHANDDDVFIHSTTTRGSTGGLSLAVPAIVAIMDAMRKDIIFVETVGAGQVGMDIRHLVHTNLVVVTPTMGDDIQTLKAGILESAHIFVLNKSDHMDTAATLQALNMMIQLGTRSSDSWKPLIVQTQATKNRGVRELSEKISQHHNHLKLSSSSERTNQHIKGLLALIMRERIMAAIQNQVSHEKNWQAYVDRIIKKEIDPYRAADEILDKILERLYQSTT